MVVNSCLEDLKEKMRLKRVWGLAPQVGKKRNKRVEVGSGSGFRQFH